MASMWPSRVAGSLPPRGRVVGSSRRPRGGWVGGVVGVRRRGRVGLGVGMAVWMAMGPRVVGGRPEDGLWRVRAGIWKAAVAWVSHWERMWARPEGSSALPERVPVAVRSEGMRELAVRSQSRVVAMGRPGVPIWAVAVERSRTSGMVATRAMGWSTAGGRPGALEVGEGVEGVGGGCLALEVDAGAALGDVVGSAEGGEGEMAGDGVGAEGALGVGGDGDVAAEAGVVAEEEAAGFAEGSVRHSPWRSMGTSARVAARLRVPSRRTVPASATMVSVRAGWASRRRCHCCGSGSQRANSASVREKGVFSGPSLRLRRAPVASM